MRYPWAGSAKPLDGAKAASDIKDELKLRVEQLGKQGIVPGLGTLLVGADPASEVYVAAKHKDCDEVGIRSIDVRLPEDATKEQVEAAIDQLNADPACSGFIIQLPLPAHLDASKLLARMDPNKDADGLHPFNLGRLVDDISGTEVFPRPCTPRGIVELLLLNGVDLNGAQVAVVGRGLTVGRPLSLLLTTRAVGATAVLCHTGTKDLAEQTKAADVIIAAAGVPGLITADMVKPGATVVDVGVARVDGKIAGDVAEDVADIAYFVSPNPGGVGPMTRAMLLANVVELAEQN